MNDIFTNKRGETYKWNDEDCINCGDGVEEVYFFDEEGKSKIEKNSSIGEFISRKITDNDNLYCFLLNFDSSHIRSARELNVYERLYGKIFTKIILFDSEEDIKQYCKEFIYTDLDFNKTPRDRQTILRKQNLFTKIEAIVQGRAVYKNQKDGYFYYVDNLHNGKATHIEVFNGSNHIGEADINFGKIDESKKDTSKKLEK